MEKLSFEFNDLSYKQNIKINGKKKFVESKKKNGNVSPIRKMYTNINVFVFWNRAVYWTHENHREVLLGQIFQEMIILTLSI